LDSSSIKKPKHKFFERFLDNDLNDLYAYLENELDNLLNNKLTPISEEDLDIFTKYNGAATQLGKYYNIFNFKNAAIDELRVALKEMAKEACNYYGIDYKKYYINGWFNYDQASHLNNAVSPVKNANHYHDHMGGTGAPIFHGYYCINAEPSSTFYKINNSVEFENVNKNNRAILSETGHPHGRDDWYEDKPRMTIAYDLTPINYGGNWIEL
jgi:hypothetical protein